MSVMGDRLGRKMCEALGLNPNEITHISIHSSIGKPALVDVTYVVHSDKEEPLTQVFKSYTLEEVEP